MQVSLLDCTLRDGGYVNDWKFGQEAIKDMIRTLESTGVDILELGFIKDEPYNEDRTVFNNMEQVKELIGQKKAGVKYAVMAEVVNPLPLEKLSPASDDGPEIIRVIVWKRMLQEGYEYCRGIVEKGYRLCVQPARVSQYNDEEFVNMIKLFNQLDPMAVYVVDSWGTMYADTLLHYMRLADEHLKQSIAIGYHGHNNMMQAFDVACAFACQNLQREVIIDASIYGIGRGAGNLNIELFAKWMNDIMGKSYNLKPMIKVYDKYIKSIYQETSWGFSIPYFISAKYNCNPNFANYFSNELNVSSDEIEQSINELSTNERIIFDKIKADNVLYKIRKRDFSLCIVIPTYKRKDIVRVWLESKAEIYYKYGIDLFFIGGKDDYEIEKFINKYNYKNVFFKIYNEEQQFLDTIDEKVYFSIKYVMDSYDAIWPCRDRSIPDIEKNYNYIKKSYKSKDDFFVLFPFSISSTYVLKKYTNSKELVLKHFGDMTSLGSVIYFHNFCNNLINNYPVSENINVGLWQPVALCHAIADKNINVSYLLGNNFTYIPYEESSFWLKNNSFMDLWTKKWPNIISNLPEYYDSIKEDMYKFTNWHLNPFDMFLLMHLKKNNCLSFVDVIKNRNILKKITNKHFKDVIFASILPCKFANDYLTNRKKALIRFIRFIKRDIIDKIFTDKKKYIDDDIFLDKKFFKYENNFSKYKNVESLLLLNTSCNITPWITIIIPTYKRYSFLKEALDSICDMEKVNYPWEIIIVDNDPYDGKINKTQEIVEKYKILPIKYYRNRKNIKVAGNMNRGVTLSNSKWISFLHDDDMLLPNYLVEIANIIQVLEKRGDIGMISGYHYLLLPSTSKECLAIDKYILMNKLKKASITPVTRSCLLYTGGSGFCAPTAGNVYNKQAIIEYGGFDEEKSIIGDIILGLNIMKKYNVYLVNSAMGIYRQENNETSKKIDDIIYNLYKLKINNYNNSIHDKVIKFFTCDIFKRKDLDYFYSVSGGNENQINRIKKFEIYINHVSKFKMFIANNIIKIYQKYQKIITIKRT